MTEKIDRTWYDITPNMYSYFNTSINEAIRQTELRLKNLKEKRKNGTKVIHRRTHIRDIDGVLIVYHNERIALVTSRIRDKPTYDKEMKAITTWMEKEGRTIIPHCDTVC